MDGAADPVFTEAGHELVAGEREPLGDPQGVLVPDVAPAGGDRREHEPRRRDVGTIIRGVLLPAAVEAVELRSCTLPIAALISVMVVVAGSGMKASRSAVVDDPPEMRIIRVRCRRHHPALSGRQVLWQKEKQRSPSAPARFPLYRPGA